MAFKKCLKLILPCLLAVFFLQAASAAAPKKAFPRPAGAVNDFAGIIPPDTAAAMENLARELLEKTGTSVVVATVKSLDGGDPDMYANELYADWGIGKKGEDKGVLIFLALEERKVRIETGYGAEGILPDGLAGSILDKYVIPLLKQGQYDKGLFNAMLAAGQVIAKDAGVTIGQGYTLRASARQKTGKGQGAGIVPLLFLLFFLFVFLKKRSGLLPLLLLSALSGRGSSFGGGGFSGGFGGFGGGMSGGGGASRGF